MIEQPWHISVLIPARDEEDLLPRCLRSVLSAASSLPQKITFDIVVAVDSSTDRTHSIAQSMLRNHGTVLSTDAGIVGQARALAADAALARYSGPHNCCWLASTDADCCVPETWLTEHLCFAASGVEAVAGRIDVDSFEQHSATVREQFQKTYFIHPDGTHPHVHGANLGVRADVYLRSGGWRNLATAEDHDLWKRLFHIGAKTKSPASLTVLTSGRRVGRAPHGFAAALAAHNTAAA